MFPNTPTSFVEFNILQYCWSYCYFMYLLLLLWLLYCYLFSFILSGVHFNFLLLTFADLSCVNYIISKLSGSLKQTSVFLGLCTTMPISLSDLRPKWLPITLPTRPPTYLTAVDRWLVGRWSCHTHKLSLFFKVSFTPLNFYLCELWTVQELQVSTLQYKIKNCNRLWCTFNADVNNVELINLPFSRRQHYSLLPQ